MFKVNIEDIVRTLNKFITVMNYEMLLVSDKSVDKRPINRYEISNLSSFEMRLLDLKDDGSVKAKYVIPVETKENEKEIVKVYLYIYILSNPKRPYMYITDYAMFPDDATKHYMMVDEKLFCGEFDPLNDKDKCKAFGLMIDSIFKSLLFENDRSDKFDIYCGCLAELVSKYLGVDTKLFDGMSDNYRDEIYLANQRLKDSYTVKNRYNMDCFRGDASITIVLKDFLNDMTIMFGNKQSDD